MPRAKNASFATPSAHQSAATAGTTSVAVIGSGMSGVTCARTLAQAGYSVTLFDKSRGVGGRMSTRQSAFGNFDHGTQYFTVRDPRFTQALATTPAAAKRWSANTVRVLDDTGHVLSTNNRTSDTHTTDYWGSDYYQVQAYQQQLHIQHQQQPGQNITHNQASMQHNLNHQYQHLQHNQQPQQTYSQFNQQQNPYHRQHQLHYQQHQQHHHQHQQQHHHHHLQQQH